MATIDAIIEAEGAVIGCAFADPDMIPHAGLTQADFSSSTYGKIWSKVLDLFSRSLPVDLVTVSSELSSVGVEPIAQLCGSQPTGQNIAHYAKIVRQASIGRKVDNIAREIGSTDLDGEARLAKLYELADEVRKDAPTGGEPFSQAMIRTIKLVEDIHENAGKVIGIETGLGSLDAATCGIERGLVTVIAARPSAGKSSLIAQIAIAMADSGLRIGYYTLEDTSENLCQRMTSQISGISLSKIRAGRMSPDELGQFTKYGIRIGDMLGSKVRLCRSVKDSISGLVTDLRGSIHKHKLDVIFVDYFQLLGDSDTRGRNRNEELTKVSLALKNVAESSNVAMVVCSQLNREAAKNPPQLHNLRDCGSLEQDANLVLMLWKPPYKAIAEGEWGDVRMCYVRKNKNGPTGEVPLTFKPQCVRFGNMGQMDSVGYGNALRAAACSEGESKWNG